MNEIWKDIEGYDGIYQVSNLGRVRSVDHIGNTGGRKAGRTALYKGKVLKQQISSSGYFQVVLVRYPNISVHRAVAKAFVPGYFEGAQVNHKDENKQNNRYDNLEWVTQKENNNYGTRNKRCLEWLNKNRAISVEQYTLDGILVAEYPSQGAAARSIGCCQKDIHRAIDTHHTVKGYRFKRKTN